MKKSITLVCILALCHCAHAQKDIVYLKNGSVIKGTVLERTDSIVKIKTRDGSLFVYPTSEIQQRINKEEAHWESIDVRAARRHHRLLVGFSAALTTSLWNFKTIPQKVSYGVPIGPFQYAPDAGFVGGFTLSYYVGNVGVESGLLYMTNSIYYTSTYLNSNNASVIETQSSRYHSLRLPLLFTAATKGTKVRFVASIGASADLMLLVVEQDNLYGKYIQSTTQLYPAKNTINPQPPYYFNGRGGIDQLFGMQAQVGVEASLAPKVMLRVSPAFYYGLPSSVSGGIDVKLLFKVKGR